MTADDRFHLQIGPPVNSQDVNAMPLRPTSPSRFPPRNRVDTLSPTLIGSPCLSSTSFCEGPHIECSFPAIETHLLTGIMLHSYRDVRKVRVARCNSPLIY